jgi:hypothetical protein
VRQYLYTCCRCGCEERTADERDEAPFGWSIVNYQRLAPAEDGQQTQFTTLTTHACASCSPEVLSFLEKESPGKDIDRAFDHGGDA